ncbi:MAG: hypothetical protein KBD29_00175 [Candidatus Magasanikbacteria bacterium]|nr:hypothetical protein [Candidatus Magasanikbacteria bacterium]
MEIDSQVYFYVVLSGFITVWTFRYLTKSKKQSDTFEYLGLSAFWGLIIIVLSTSYLKLVGKNVEEINTFYTNPLSVGFNLSIFFGPFLGFLGYLLVRPIKSLIGKILKKTA